MTIKKVSCEEYQEGVLTNLLAETMKALRFYEKDPSEVKEVQFCRKWDNEISSCTWLDFSSMAEHINYANRIGGQYINPTLRVIGKGWWLERSSVIGGEGWTFNNVPKLLGNPVDLMTEDLINS